MNLNYLFLLFKNILIYIQIFILYLINYFYNLLNFICFNLLDLIMFKIYEYLYMYILNYKGFMRYFLLFLDFNTIEIYYFKRDFFYLYKILLLPILNLYLYIGYNKYFKYLTFIIKINFYCLLFIYVKKI